MGSYSNTRDETCIFARQMKKAIKLGDEFMRKKGNKNSQSQYKNISTSVFTGALDYYKIWENKYENVSCVEGGEMNFKCIFETKLQSKEFLKFKEIEEQYSKIKQKKLPKTDNSTLKHWKNLKLSLQFARRNIKKYLLSELEDKILAFVSPVSELFGKHSRAFITSRMANRFIKESKIALKSKSWKKLDPVLNKYPQMALVILNIALRMLSWNDTVALIYFIIKSRMSAKNKELLLDKERRAHIYEEFKKRSERLRKKMGKKITKARLRALEDLSGEYKENSSLVNQNAKRKLGNLEDIPRRKKVKVE